jgi:hypothetical protein
MQVSVAAAGRSDSMKPKLYIINNGLKDLRGHYYETSVSIAEASLSMRHLSQRHRTGRARISRRLHDRSLDDRSTSTSS